MMLQFPPTQTPVQEDGLLSPDGTYYPCGYCYHDNAAMEIAGVDAWTLETCGWIHISNSWLYHEKEFTQSQIDTLFDMLTLDPTSRLGRNISQEIK